MTDDEKMADEFEKHCQREELIWEIWLRILMHQVMPDRETYNNWLIVRANRSPEEKYGMPDQ